ncbi:DNA polymerase Y family protein [Sphingomonas sp. MJ1 (PH-R8)]|uniref:Y-family DNA polymerase n=1 Tax=Sphingomonas sp. MJ1 (PH-R8) TaxID=3112950 RepID=UPI003A861956
MKRVAALFLPDWPIDRLRQAERTAAPPEAGRTGSAFAAIGRVAEAERASQCSVPKEGGWRPGARWARAEVEAAIEQLPTHQRPPQRELGRTSVAADNPFKGERPFKDVHRQGRPLDASPASAAWAADAEAVERAIAALPLHQQPPFRELSRRSEVMDHPFKAMPPDEGGCSHHALAQPQAFPRSDRPTLAQMAAMPAVQYPGEGPHPDAHGREPIAGYAAAGRFFQTGRTLGDLVARVCVEEVPGSPVAARDTVPLVTAARQGGRVAIAAASPAAQALGLRPGMALTQARAQVPELQVRDADPAGDCADLRRLAMLLARRWTPVVDLSDPDGLLLDLTGVAHLHGGEARMALRLVRLLARHGVNACVGIADTAGAAWALARQGGAAVRICPPGAQAEALDPLPAGLLRLPESAIELLARLGVTTIGQLRALPRGQLARRFGDAVLARLDQALGARAEPLDPVVPPERVQVRQRFAEPIATAEAIAHWLGELVPRLVAVLRKAGLGARQVELVLDRVDGVPQRLRIGLARASRDSEHLLRLLGRRIETVEPGYGIDAMALHVRRAEPLGAETLGAALVEDTPPDLGPLVDQIVNRIGAQRMWRVVPVESDVPERASTRVAPLDPADTPAAQLREDDVRRLDGREADHPWHLRWPRPVRVLRRPERLDHVMAELPDQPPRRFTWRGVPHVVVHADGPERIAGEWWRRPAERDAVRDYFRVEDEHGHRFWLYRSGDGLRGETGDLSWWLQGMFA